MASRRPDDATVRTVRQLVNLGFPQEKAVQAVENIGDKSDVDLAVSWLLDHGEEDRGGAVEFKHCPHIQDYGYRSFIPLGSVQYGRPCVEGCHGNENWLCLCCGETRCGRYMKRHGIAHHAETKHEEEAKITVADAAAGRRALGHFVAINNADLSVWCYECDSYVQHEVLLPYVRRMEQLKFGGGGSSSSGSGSGSSGSGGPAPMDVEPEAGSALEAPAAAMHGILGDAAWAAPRLARACGEEARPGYKTKKAHEYVDTEEVLAAKVKVVADLIRKSRNLVAYTGAGISTASGIDDYATKASSSVAREGVAKVSPWAAQPTLAHRVLVGLFHAGHLKQWVQQNHDGLPQKAGFPQQFINEIHGAWYDPSNPVVPMSGTLRDDLIKRMLEWEERADLCLALGTSMVGMNADRMAVTPAQKAKTRKALGTVIVGLQQTQYDAISSVRIYARIDDVMAAVAAELGMAVPAAPGLSPAPGKEPHVFEGLPYGKDGKLDRGARMTLDLREGSRVRIVNQPDWDRERLGNTGVVIETQDAIRDHGHYAIRFGGDGAGGQLRVLGRWWLDAAAKGEVGAIPVVSEEEGVAEEEQKKKKGLLSYFRG